MAASMLGKIGAVSATAILMGSTKTGHQILKSMGGTSMLTNNMSWSKMGINAGIGAGGLGAVTVAQNLLTGQDWNRNLGGRMMAGAAGGGLGTYGMRVGRNFAGAFRGTAGARDASLMGARAMLGRASGIPFRPIRTGARRGIGAMSRASRGYSRPARKSSATMGATMGASMGAWMAPPENPFGI